MRRREIPLVSASQFGPHSLAAQTRREDTLAAGRVGGLDGGGLSLPGKVADNVRRGWTMSFTIADVLEQLEGVKATGKNKWQARCPAHEDNKPSLSVGTGGNSKVLLKCFAECEYKDILKALGLDNGKATHTAKPQPGRKIVRTHDYQDEDGNVLYQVVRFEPKDFRQRRPDGNGGYQWGLERVRRVLYRLPELVAAEQQTPVFICEGEHDADSLAELRLTATTCPMGAGKWRTEYTPFLKDRNVAILPHTDEPGRKHAARVAAELLGTAASVKVIELPGIPAPGNDVTDWLNAGHIKEELLYLVEQAEAYEPTAPFTPILKTLGDVNPEPIRWLWPGRIAIGKLTLLAGDPGLGKSFITLDLAARVSRGDGWPHCPTATGEPGGVVLLSAEDDLADTIRPRLDAAGADVKRIAALTAVTRFDADSGQHREHPFNLAKDLAVLEQAIARVPDCRLVVIDPISAYLGGTDSHKNAEIRGLLAPLSQLASRYAVAVLAVTHLRKGDGQAIYRAMGSLAFIAAARAGYCVTHDHEDTSGRRRLMLPMKNNLGEDRTGLAYRLMAPSSGIPSTAWESEPVTLSVDEALNDNGQGQGHDNGAPERDEAAKWLRETLADGPLEAKTVYTQARQDGVAKRTLDRAKRGLRVIAYREGFGADGSWLWKLPQAPDRHIEAEKSRGCRATDGQDTTPETVAIFGDGGNLWENDGENAGCPAAQDPLNAKGCQVCESGSLCHSHPASGETLDPDNPGPLDVLDEKQRKRYLAIYHSRSDGMAPAEKHRRAWRIAVGG